MTTSESAPVVSDPPGECSLSESQRISDLLPALYAELKKLASLQMTGERSDHTLSPTALLNEAFIRLQRGAGSLGPDVGRVALFAAAAEVMRRILIEHARKHCRRRSILRTDFFSDIRAKQSITMEAAELVTIDDAISRLTELHPEKAQLVKLRFFAGLTLTEAAGVMSISLATANRHWRYARAWLTRELRDGSDR